MASYSRETLQAYAENQASQYGIPADYFSRFIETESSWNPNAVSPAGAQGIAQIMPDTAGGKVDTFDPFASIEFAASLLAKYFNQFGSWDQAFAAYNAGPGAVSKYGGVPPYPETQNYIERIIGKVTGTTPMISQRGHAMMSLIFWAAAIVAIVFALRLMVK